MLTGPSRFPTLQAVWLVLRCVVIGSYDILLFSDWTWRLLCIILRQWIEIFLSNRKKYLKSYCNTPCAQTKAFFFKEMRHLHQASQLCSGWYGIFCLFACWCNRDISVPHSLPLLIKQLHNRMVCPESPSQRFCRWRARLCALLQHRCLKEHLQLFHPPGLNGGPQSWYISYLWFSYR